jgi:hypothetical protein
LRTRQACLPPASKAISERTSSAHQLNRWREELKFVEQRLPSTASL